MPTFHDLVTAAYCPRKLYYVRRDDYDVPAEVAETRALAFLYDELADASDHALSGLPLAVSPDEFRSNLARSRDRVDCWPELVVPSERDRLVSGKDCTGIVHKVLDLDVPTPSMISAGKPPKQGVWEPDSVRAVAAAKALSWEHETPVERAFVEYPSHGVVRELRLTTRRKATYRRVLRTVRALDGPPPRLKNDAKCKPCDYSDRCGVRTRSLRSLLR